MPAWKRTLYIVWCTQFIALAGAMLVFPFLPLYLEDLGVHDKGQIAFYSGLTGTAFGVAQFISSPIWGSLADRYGRKVSLLRAYLGAMVATGLQSINHDLTAFMFILALQGAFAGTPPAAAALIASTAPRDKVPYGLGLLQMALFVSGIAGPLIGGVLSEAIGMRSTFRVASVGFGLSFLLVLFTVKEDFQPPAVRRGPIQTFTDSFKVASASASIMKMILMLFLINASAAFGRTIIPLFVKLLDPGGPTKAEASYVFAALGVTGALAALLVGNFAGRIGHRKVLIVLILGAGLAYIPVVFASNLPHLIVFIAIAGFFSGGCLPSASALLSLNTPGDRQGAVFGFAGSAQALAGATAPLLGGVVAATLGVRAVYFFVAMALVSVGLLATWLVPHPPAPAPHDPELVEAES